MSHLVLTLALEGGEWSGICSARVIPEEGVQVSTEEKASEGHGGKMDMEAKRIGPGFEARCGTQHFQTFY
jgi:hypothetical protein